MGPSIRTRLYRYRRRLETGTRQSEFLWRNTFNLRRRIMAAIDDRASDCTDASRIAIGQLQRRGVAITSVEELFDEDDQAYHDVAEASREWAAAHSGGEAPTEDDGPRKGYVKRLLDGASTVPYARPGTPAPDIYASMALHPRIVEIARRYLGLVPQLVHYDVWWNLPTPTTRHSQLWHRDPEDRKIVKVFINLATVSADHGPFHYAAGSHPAGRGYHLDGRTRFAPRRGAEDRLTDEAMASIVAPTNWVQLTGPPGTIAIADTAGYHKGGNRSDPRLLFTCTFVSAVAKLPVAAVGSKEPR